MKHNPERLILAREVRGMTQTHLAKVSKIDQGSISKYEGGLKEIPDYDLAAIAQVLKFPKAFFSAPGERHGVETGELFHRKQRSVKGRELDRINARLNIYRLHVERLLEVADVEMEQQFNIPRYDPREFNGNIEDIAAMVRAAWRIPSGPIQNLMQRLESASFFIHVVDFEAVRLDETVQWCEPMHPIILVNSNAPGDRLRFSLAHALGHLVMHHNREPYEGMEDEAQQFAAAFLMPADDVRENLTPATIEHFLQIKPAWKVSMQALIHRALELGVINQTRYTSLFQMLSRAGYRKLEPFPLRPEQPKLFSKLVRYCQNELEFSNEVIADALSISEDDLEQWYLSKPSYLRLVDKSDPDGSNGGNLSIG